MDPFTQRMLERAKARREKLDTQLSNAGHDVRKRRSPLKDANAILAQAPAIKISQSTTKPTVKTTSIKQSSEKSPSKDIIHEGKAIDKENGENPATSVRSKLQRLGKLYSEDSSRELSSPIHRTEEKFTSEDEPNEHKSCKSGARLDRLAALASTINNWEDDLSHPTLSKCTEGKTVKAKATFNNRVESIEDPQPSTSGQSKWRSNNASCSQVNRKLSNGNQNGHREDKGDVKSTKQLKWDNDVLKTLEAQGFSRTVSNTRLVYDYKRCSQESRSDLPKAKEQLDNEQFSKKASSAAVTASTSKFDGNRTNVKAKEDNKTVVSKPTNSLQTSNSSQGSRTPEKTGKNVNAGGCSARIGSKLVCTGSPRSPVQSPGSVLSKASMFESKNMEPKPKDPAEMTLSERMALFERNKGEAPLVPKAPLTMSVPTKKLMEKDKPSSHNGETSTTTPTRSNGDVNNKVVNRRAIFEDGGHVQELENDILRISQTERQRELDMLRSRFNRNREVAQVAAGSCIRTSESSEGGKPNSPKNSPVCPVKPTPASDFVPPPPPLPQTQSSSTRSIPIQVKSSPVKRQVVNSPPKSSKQTKLHFDIKRIRVSPPKPGHLYPDLSNIEITETESTESTESEYTVGETEPETATLDERTETETEAEYYVREEETEDDYTEESEDMANTSLGRSILRVVSQKTISKKKRSIDPDPDSTTSDISVLDEMDEYLDECLAVQEAHGDDGTRLEGPTPPKLNKGGKSSSTISASFNPSYRSPIKLISPTSSPRRGEPYIVEGDNCVPLMHSVSFYRRQQSQTPKTPVRLVSRTGDDEIVSTSSSSRFDEKDEAALVQEKVKQLLEDMCKQQTVIGQASQALNLCNATIEFSGSREQVEGERLLLVATHRRQAALNEVQRLKVEGTLRPVVPGSPEFDERGSLTISAITLPLKRDYFRNVDSDTCLHFVCLVRHMEFVVATPVVLAVIGDSCIRFPSTLKLQDLCSDFKITIEIYSLETRAEILPHEIKYHIHSCGTVVNSGGGGSAKKASGKTPKKFLKQDSRLIMPTVQSPAGPSAVRSPAFSLSGYVVFSLKEVQRQQFTLNKVPQSSPLEGRLQMHVTCELSVSVEHHGFLTMFEDISGFGAWHRRWCLLKGATLSYWKYPDDERKKTPIGSLDLQGLSTTNVGLVSRDICARSNTFLLETIRPAQPGDSDSLVMIRKGSQTTIRHLLSADTKEDRLEWCSKLNKTLNLIRAWGGASASL